MLYAFCRLADDAVDDSAQKAAAVIALERRLDLAYRGAPRNAPVDRAFARLIAQVALPRALPEALIEGLAWDAEGRRYSDLSGVLAYSARVAAAVGAMMCLLMGVRDPHRLARACDLGLAMQLTNIARDVGEDAREGRLYLPTDWLDAEGVNPATIAGMTTASPALKRLTRRLLSEGNRLYLRAEPGITALPLSCRPGIMAARLVYDGIGQALAARDHDNIAHRARTTGRQKLVWLGRAGAESLATTLMPRPATLYAPPAAETAFLVRAAADYPAQPDRSDKIMDILATLRARDLAARTVETRNAETI